MGRGSHEFGSTACRAPCNLGVVLRPAVHLLKKGIQPPPRLAEPFDSMQWQKPMAKAVASAGRPSAWRGKERSTPTKCAA